MRVLFFGTSSWVVPILEKLNTSHEIIGMITTPDALVGRKQVLTPSPIGTAADRLKLPYHKPESLKNNDEIKNLISNLKPDVAIVASYGKIIPLNLLDLLPQRFINIHPSLLPHYRGPTPMQTALLNGDTITGMSIMIMDEQVDHGPIIAQEKMSIHEQDTLIDLENKFSESGTRLLLHALDQLMNGSLVTAEQDHNKATFTKMISKADGRIDWNKTAQEVYNQYRAYIVWPGIWTTKNESIVKILNCKIDEKSSTEVPGTILESGSIACGQGTTLHIEEIQEAGGKITSMADFLRGHKNWINTSFNI